MRRWRPVGSDCASVGVRHDNRLYCARERKESAIRRSECGGYRSHRQGDRIAVGCLREMHFRAAEGVAAHLTYIGAGILVRVGGIPSRHENLRRCRPKTLSRPGHGQLCAFFGEDQGEKLSGLGFAGITRHFVGAPRRLKEHFSQFVSSFFLPRNFCDDISF